MIPIVPAVMPRNFKDLRDKIQRVHAAVDLVQIDIMDGGFVPGRTWPYPLEPDITVTKLLPEGLPHWDSVDYEIDLMIKCPEDNFDLWRDLGPAAVVIHYESVKNWDKMSAIIDNAKDYIDFGLSFDDELDKSFVEEKIGLFSYIQCMGINEIGSQAQPFSDRVIENVSYFREKYPDMLITVDGSVNFDSIKNLYEAGARRFVAGSAVYNYDNPAAQVEELLRLIQ